MAGNDKKISDLTALTTPLAADVLVIVDDSESPDVTKKVTWANLFRNPQALTQFEVRSTADATPGILLLSTQDTSVVDGDKLGRIDFQAPLEDGTPDGILIGASIWAEADATFGAASNETDIVFATAVTAAVTEKMRLTAYGELDLTHTVTNAGKEASLTTGITSDITLTDDDSSYQQIGVNSACRYAGSGSNTNSSGVRSFSAFIDKSGSGTLTNCAGLFVDVRNTSGTTTNMSGVRVIGATESGTAITNFFGFKCEANAVGGNNYGFHSLIAASSGDFNFYAAGTAINYFEGDTGVGMNAPTSKLHVDQNASGGAKPVVTLDQKDVSEEMMEFLCDIGTGNAIEAIASKTLTTTHFIKVTIEGGLTRYFPVGTIA